VDELAAWVFVWFSYLGISNLVGKKGHASIDVLVSHLCKKTRIVIEVLGNICILIALIIVLYTGIPFASKMMSIYWGNLPFPKGVATIAIPINISFMVVHLLFSAISGLNKSRRQDLE
jgi:TRAP-type C4-dicarboxylate transport system permease small subunit